MSTFSSFAGDGGGDTLGGFRSRSAGAGEKIEASPIKEEEEEELVAAGIAGSPSIVVGENRNISRHCRKLSRATQDWSSLPEPAVHLILMGMRPSFRDVFSFAGVCKAWRSVFTDCKRELFSSMPPLLVDCGSSSDALGHFYSLVEQRFFRRKQPIPWGWVCAGGSLYLSDWCVSGVSHGYWIITPMKNSEGRSVFLLDPLFPESRIDLPPSPLYFSRPGKGIRAVKFRWALMTAPPTSPDCVVVVAHRCYIWYCRPGDAEWVRHDFTDGSDGALDDAAPWCYNEDQVAVLGRQLFALGSSRKLVVVELLFPRPWVAVVDVEGLPFEYDELDQLVESDGEILYIADQGGSSWEHRDGGFGAGRRPRCEHRYVVLRLDLPAQRWVALDTLGKRSIFLPRHRRGTHSPGTPVTCVGAAEWGGREDCIYSSCVGSGTFVVWSMKDASLEHHPLPEELPYCEWLVPSFCCR